MLAVETRQPRPHVAHNTALRLHTHTHNSETLTRRQTICSANNTARINQLALAQMAAGAMLRKSLQPCIAEFAPRAERWNGANQIFYMSAPASHTSAGPSAPPTHPALPHSPLLHKCRCYRKQDVSSERAQQRAAWRRPTIEVYYAAC